MQYGHKLSTLKHVTAEYEDTSYAQNGIAGGCPTPANSSVRPAYIVPNNPTISDPWSFYKRTLTFQASQHLSAA